MTLWHIIALLTPALGAAAIVYGLRFFPVTESNDDQYSLDLGAPRDYARPKSAMAQEVDKATMTVKDEVNRIKGLRKLK